MTIQRDNKLAPIMRLFIAGKMNQFEHSVLAGDKKAMVEILLEVELKPSQATAYTQEILGNPRKYGYCLGGCLRS